MTSSDVRDVLNLPDGLSGHRPSKKQKTSAPRPSLKGLAREVHMLSGDNPIAIIPEVQQFKKRRLASRKPASKWEMKGFRNSARADPTLILRHWRRIEDEKSVAPATSDEAEAAPGQTRSADGETEAPEKEALNSETAADGLEDSAFAKFNAQVSIPQYTDEQYQQSLQNPAWTKPETDYLMETARDFDLRWPLIWDRYEWKPQATDDEAAPPPPPPPPNVDESKAIVPAGPDRSMEELKARYYEIAAKMMALQKPVQFMSQQEFQLHELMAHFNVAQEKARKEFASNALHRSPEDAKEEESLLLEIKRILARSERFNEERRELYRRLDYPHSEADISTIRSSAGLQNLLQNLMTTAEKSKKRKSLMGTDGVSPSGPAGTFSQQTAQDGGGGSVRRDSTAAASTGGHRDSIGGVSQTPTAGNNKKGQPLQQQPERRKLTEQEEAIYGVAHFERLGSGPTFRTEKINKLFSHKSNQQALRINNALNELDVPARLAMPTAATTQQYESLLAAVNNLLDARKQADKLDADLKIEEAKRAEKEKLGHAPKAEGQRSGEQQQGKTKTKMEEASTEPPAIRSSEDGQTTEGGASSANSKQMKMEPPEVEGTGLKSDAMEKDGRPWSSGTSHKRSASVLSSVSDKSSKRLKK